MLRSKFTFIGIPCNYWKNLINLKAIYIHKINIKNIKNIDFYFMFTFWSVEALLSSILKNMRDALWEEILSKI